MASKRIRYWVSLILVFTFVIGLIFPAVATSAKAAAGLTDISDHWAKDKITQWVQKGLVSGYTDGTFKPDKSITRAEFMTLVNKVLGFSEKATIGFSDVTSTDWFYEEIAKAVKAGYISGYQDGTVKPNREISRQEAAVALCKALNLEIQGDATEFTDKDAIPNWSRPYIAALAAKGYMGGYPDGSFKAERHITRAETVTILDKVLATLQISYDVSGAYGPEEGIETISQDVAVNVPGVTLRNMIIEGNLYLNEGIGEGDATLDNVTVKGITTVRGGGKDSIHLVNFTGEEIIVIKVGGKVRIVASGNTKVGELKLESGAHIEGNGIVSVTVLKSGEDIILDGAFENVIVEAKAKIEVLKGTTINNLKANSKSDINLADGATVKDLTLEAAATITGKGTIEKAKINADGAKLETEPKKVELAKGVTTEIAGKEVKEDKTSSKSGGGGGSGGGSDKPEIIKVQSVSLDKSSVTLAVYESVYQKTTITATIHPNNATNKKVTWKSSNNGVATVAGNGLNATVNAVSEGRATITVTTDDGGKTAECEVTVVAGEVPVVPVSALSVTPTTMTLTVGETGTITATVEPANATNKKVNWTSSDANIATVDADGIVTAKAKGIANITAISAADSSKKATCKVIVADNWSDVADTTWYNDTDSSFTVSTAEQLAGLAKLVNEENDFANKTITLGADIDLLGLEWVPIGYAKRDGYKPEGPSFQGVFDGDGQGKTISNLKITAEDNTEDGSAEYAYGLIGCMTKGSVKNLTIANPQIEGTGYSNGAVIGFLSYGYSDNNDVITIENCTVVGGKIEGHQAVGGIIGRLIGSKDSNDNDEALRIKVVNCKNIGTDVEVTSNHAAGGIVGNQYRTNSTEQVLIKDCVNSGNVTSLYMAGGIAGQIAVGTLDGGENTGTIRGGYTSDTGCGHYNGGQLIGYSTGAKIRNVKDLFDLKNIFETEGGMPIYIELTGDISATGYKGEENVNVQIETDTITMKNCRFLDFSGDTTLTVAEGKTIYLYTGYNNTVRGKGEATLTIAGEGNVNVGKEGSLEHFYKDKAGTVVAADGSDNVEKGKYNLFVKSEDNANGNQEIWVDATPPTLQSLTACVGEEERVAEDNTLTWTVGETVTKIEAAASEPVRLVDGAEAVVTMSGGTIPEGTVYGTISIDSDDPTKIIITPNSGNETAGLAGTFAFTVAEGVIEDLAGNKNAAVNITLNVQPDQAAIEAALAAINGVEAGANYGQNERKAMR
ncbi:S-layer homology domain-containing protein [Tepidanaerobacter acetatoxydans]|uniref:S-layer homology domain-containing protein n=1 Tax=Tepidanaerobacter acetatoxydans TaxID=499229 RepID=UPI001BD3062D|nr:S-layer homology domain-containing protein [Tepidanaerobacter acetatoxydans]